jgi:hypothetical protein
MSLNMFLPAVIGIVGCFLAVLPRSPGYSQVPLSIIGKVYANSMLVLINSRMVLVSEETRSANASVMRFHTASSNRNDHATEAHRGDPSVYNEWPGPSRRSEPGEV